MSVAVVVFITTFLASAVEATEMITIVVGVGATRGWRSTLLGAATGFAVLAVVVVLAGAALAAVPIGALRFVVGALLLTFGLQWFRKGIVRVAARGLAGIGEIDPDQGERWQGRGVDGTAFVLSFKGVVLEGLEVGFIVVSFGSTANEYGAAIIGGLIAIVSVGALGLAANQLVARLPRSFLQLIVGIMLTTFGTFWSLEGLGVEWPASDAAILALLGLYALTAFVYTTIERRRFHPATEAAA